MLWRSVTLTVGALSRMIAVQNLGRPHIVFATEAIWCDAEGDRDADAAMWREFSNAGLTDGAGRLADDALDTLATFARAQTEYFAMFTSRGHQRAALVATGASETALAYRSGTTVRISSVRDESPTAALLRQLPDMPAARIDSVNVRTDQLGTETDLLASWDTESPAGRDARTLVSLARRKMIGQGELYVGVRDRIGRYRRSDPPIRYHDMRTGRVLITLPGGYVSVAGATKNMLLTHLQRAHQDLLNQG